MLPGRCTNIPAAPPASIAMYVPATWWYLGLVTNVLLLLPPAVYSIPAALPLLPSATRPEPPDDDTGWTIPPTIPVLLTFGWVDGIQRYRQTLLVMVRYYFFYTATCCYALAWCWAFLPI